MKKTKKHEKSFDKFRIRQSEKKRRAERARRELISIVDEIGVDHDSLKLRERVDAGRRARVSARPHSDETSAVGIFSSSRSGFGFVRVDGVERDIFIPQGRCAAALDGDLVEVVYHIYENRFGEAKTEGRVTKIIEYSRKFVIGRIEREEPIYRTRRMHQARLVLIPDDAHISAAFPIEEAGGASVGEKVEARINRSERGHTVSVVRSFGHAYSKEANYGAILAECDIPTDFSPEELAEADFFASLPVTEEGRVRRSEVILTMDGESAKDLDDAVSLSRTRGGWLLGVHIADVSYYVRERTHLDRCAFTRGTSVYFTDKVVPMLPPALSNGACSLNPCEDKYTLSAIISLDREGNIRDAKIEASIIQSRVRGVYSEVNAILDGSADDPTRAKYKAVLPTILRMKELYEILRARSEARGTLALDTQEAYIALDEGGAPVDIVRTERGVAERIIEEFMICANEAVATLLSRTGIPCVYRVHEPPAADKLTELCTYLHNLGFDTRGIGGEKPDPMALSRVLAQAEARGLSYQVSYAMLRSMSKARYSEIRTPHFGLGLDYYCHFTSPIRRLSDLITHRIIHRVLLEGKSIEQYKRLARRAAAAASEREISALTAERRIENLYKVIYMSDRIGEEFDAVISSVTSFGFFCELANTCEGLVPISELYGGYTFDEKNLSIRSSRHVYRIGDRVRVRLEEADIIRGKLRFSVV